MGTAKVLTNCARIIKNVVKENVRVWARTPAGEYDVIIDPNKLKEPFTCVVEFSPISEEDEYRRHDDYERLKAAGIVTTRWTRERMNNVDPDQMELQEAVEKIKQDPMLQQVTSQYIAGKLAAALSTKDAIDKVDNPENIIPTQTGSVMEPPMEQQGQELPQGNRMMPPSSPKPAPASAQYIQNQMAKMRSNISQNPLQGVGGGGNNGGM
jgi:hypothetical protein